MPQFYILNMLELSTHDPVDKKSSPFQILTLGWIAALPKNFQRVSDPNIFVKD